MRDGKLVGIVARSDLIRARAHKLQGRSITAKVERETLNETFRHGREEITLFSVNSRTVTSSITRRSRLLPVVAGERLFTARAPFELKGALVIGRDPGPLNPCASLDAAHRLLRKRHSRVAGSFFGHFATLLLCPQVP